MMKKLVLVKVVKMVSELTKMTIQFVTIVQQTAKNVILKKMNVKNVGKDIPS